VAGTLGDHRINSIEGPGDPRIMQFGFKFGF
jgi:hypothetical protein